MQDPKRLFKTLFRDEHQVFVVELETRGGFGEAFASIAPFLWVAVLFFVCLYALFGFPRLRQKQRGGGIVQSVRDIYCTFTEGLHDGCTERGTYARHNGKGCCPGRAGGALLWQGAAVLGGAALGAGQVYGGAALFGLALVIGCLPSYCLPRRWARWRRLAFQPMLLGVKLAVAAVAAAVRRLIDGRPGPGALAGCLTLTAAQVLQIVLAGGIFQPGADRHGGVYGAAGRGFLAGRSRIFRRGSRAASACGWLWLRHACSAVPSGPLAPGLALAAGAGLCAAIGGTLEQTAVLSIALAAAITASGADTGLRRAGCGAGQSGGVLPLPGGAGPLRRGVCGGLHRGGTGRARRCHVLPLAVSAGVGVVAALAVPGSVLHKIFPPPAPPVQTQGLGGAARKALPPWRTR